MSYYYTDLKLTSFYRVNSNFDDLGSAVMFKFAIELRKNMFKDAPDKYLNIRDKIIFGDFGKISLKTREEVEELVNKKIIEAENNLKREIERIFVELINHSSLYSCNMKKIVNDTIMPLIIGTVYDLSFANLAFLGINLYGMEEDVVFEIMECSPEVQEIISWIQKRLIALFDSVFQSIDYFELIRISNNLKKISEVDKLLKKNPVISTWCTNNVSLIELIFDKNNICKLGQKIVESVSYSFPYTGGYLCHEWRKKYSVAVFNNNVVKEQAVKKFIQLCREDRNREEAYVFLFWSFMIMAIDKKNIAEQLSFICDFSRILRINNDEILEIISIVQAVYSGEQVSDKLKTSMVTKVFKDIISYRFKSFV